MSTTGNIRSVMTILPELRSGQVITELSAAIHDALAAVSEHNKDATVILKVTISPTTKERLKEPVVTMRAEVESKLPKEVPDSTIFFMDGEGNPTRHAPRPEQASIFQIEQPAGGQQ